MAEENQEPNRIRKFLGNKWSKIVAIGAASVAAGYGTFSSHERDFSPIYVNKTGTSGGIATGLYVKIDKDAEFYGAVIAPFTRIDGTLNGININLLDVESRGKVNGLELGLGDVPPKGEGNDSKILNGVDIGLVNIADTVNGLRGGLIFNAAEKGAYFDVGLVNANDDGDENGANHIGLILYLNVEEKEQKTD